MRQRHAVRRFNVAGAVVNVDRGPWSTVIPPRRLLVADGFRPLGIHCGGWSPRRWGSRGRNQGGGDGAPSSGFGVGASTEWRRRERADAWGSGPRRATTSEQRSAALAERGWPSGAWRQRSREDIGAAGRLRPARPPGVRPRARGCDVEASTYCGNRCRRCCLSGTRGNRRKCQGETLSPRRGRAVPEFRTRYHIDMSAGGKRAGRSAGAAAAAAAAAAALPVPVPARRPARPVRAGTAGPAQVRRASGGRQVPAGPETTEARVSRPAGRRPRPPGRPPAPGGGRTGTDGPARTGTEGRRRAAAAAAREHAPPAGRTGPAWAGRAGSAPRARGRRILARLSRAGPGPRSRPDKGRRRGRPRVNEAAG